MSQNTKGQDELRGVPGGMPRRAFLKGAGQTGLGVMAASGAISSAEAKPPSQQAGQVKIPAHLPPRLTISMWYVSWLLACSPGEPYHDLDRTFAEHSERNLNTIRADVALDWVFDREGRPRGPIEIAPWIDGGLSDNIRGLNGKGGVRYVPLERVLKMFELAKKYKVCVIATTWQYQDGSTPLLADPKLREDILSTPLPERFDHLAKMYDRLIQELKKNDLEKQLAYVELHNELNFAELPQGLLTQKPLVERALRRLQEAHPDILFTADYAGVGANFHMADFPGYDALPANMQVADNHFYEGAIYNALWDATGTWEGDHVPPDPKDNGLLRWLIGSKPRVSWEELSKGANRHGRRSWPWEWLFANLDPDRYDYWLFEHFGQYSAMMMSLIQAWMRGWGAFARQRGLPAVVSEGYIYEPPRNSRFEESAAGRLLFEHAVDTAIEQGYWGVILSTYCGPDMPIWTENPEWIKKTNELFLKSFKA
jgi:hypothetical protein